MRMATERAALRLSLVAAGATSVLGVVIGLAAGSQIVLFDGLYASIGMLLSGLSLYAVRLMDAGETSRYPFGREALGPLMVGMQGLVLLGTLGYASLDAVLVILEGGGDTDLGPALGYAVATLLGSWALAWVLRRDRTGSDLVAAEATQWAAGALLSLAMVVGFAGALVLQRSPAAWLAPFVDPALVLVSAALLLPAPIRMLRATMHEILEAAPADALQGDVRSVLAEVGEEHGLPEPTLRLSKLGRKLYVEVDYVVGDQPWTVAAADRLRHQLSSRLTPLADTLWLNLELHATPDWDR